MEIIPLYPESFGSNCYVVVSNGHGAVIDPSVPTQEILNTLAKNNATLEKIILTHGHFDHILSADELRNKTNAPLSVHEYDAELLTDSKKNAYSVFYRTPKVWRPAEKTFTDGDKIPLGDTCIEVIHTPGHTRGSVCLLADDAMFTGDTLFAKNVGRCDLYGGNISDMRASLKRLRGYDKNLKIYPGHEKISILSHALDVVSYYC